MNDLRRNNYLLISVSRSHIYILVSLKKAKTKIDHSNYYFGYLPNICFVERQQIFLGPGWFNWVIQ